MGWLAECQGSDGLVKYRYRLKIIQDYPHSITFLRNHYIVIGHFAEDEAATFLPFAKPENPAV